jgi:hypothetical protein
MEFTAGFSQSLAATAADAKKAKIMLNIRTPSFI